MATNKVIYAGNTLIDLSSDTITASDLLRGVVAHDKAGNIITGTLTVPEQQEKTVNDLLLVHGNQTVVPDVGKTLSKVIINKPDTLIAENVKKDVTIAGVVGTLEPTLQEKTVTPSTAAQSITADNGYDGLSKVTVNGDANLTADNIKSGTTIFGVKGSYAGSSPKLQSKSVTYTSNGTAKVTPDAGYDGLSSVDVTVDVAGSGGGETAENVVITSSLPSYLNRYIQICGIDKDGNKILLNGYTTPVSVKKNTLLMIRIAEYPYARISGQYTVIGVYSPETNSILNITDIESGNSRAPLIVPTGDLNIYDAD